MSPYSEFRQHRQELAREALTVSQAIGFTLFGLAYAFPGEFVRNTSIQGSATINKSVVGAMENFFNFPFFSTAFLLTALVLWIGVIWWNIEKRRHPGPETVLRHYKMYAWAHLVAMSVAMTFALTITLSAFINPGTYLVSPLLSLGMVATNAILMYAYAGTAR